MLTERWRPLDLRRRGKLGPYGGELIALYMVPKTSACSERHAVGRLEVVTGRIWMYGGGHTSLPTKMCKHYDLLWARLPEDGDKKGGPSHLDTVTRA